jgi:hypothetical protein
VRCERSLSCDDALAAELADDRVVPFAARVHVRRCEHCRRALDRHRTLRAGLRQLGTAPVPGEAVIGADTLLAAILAELDLADRRASRRARWISAGAVAGAVAGGVAAGVMAVARGRRLVVPI